MSIFSTITENNRKKFIFEHGQNRIIFSDPLIQPKNEFKYNSSDDILYFYYDIEIQRNTNYFNKSLTPIWETLVCTNVSEFGTVPYLEEFIDEMIAFDIFKNGKKIYFSEPYNDFSDFDSRYIDSLSGFFNEDEFEIKKFGSRRFNYYDSEGEQKEPTTDCIRYEMFVGLGDEIKTNTEGVYFKDLKETDLLTFKSMIHEFMEYAKEVTMKNIEEIMRKEGKINEN